MPDSVLTPAPVKTTGRRAEANSAPRRAIGSSVTAADASGAFVVASAASPAWDVGGLFATRGAPGGPTSVSGSRPASPSGGRRAGGKRSRRVPPPAARGQGQTAVGAPGGEARRSHARQSTNNSAQAAATTALVRRSCRVPPNAVWSV